MADTKISALGAAGALAGTEPLPIVQGGVTLKTTVQDVADLAAPGGGPVLVTPAGGDAGMENVAADTFCLVHDSQGIDVVGPNYVFLGDAPAGSQAVGMLVDGTTSSIAFYGSIVNLDYTPTVSSDWAGADPTDVRQALDRIAALLGTPNVTTTKP